MDKPLLLQQLPELPPNLTPPLTFQAPAGTSPIPAPPNSSLFVRVTTIDTCPQFTVLMVGFRNNGERWIQSTEFPGSVGVAVGTVEVPVPTGSLASVTVVTTNTFPTGKAFGVCWIAPSQTIPPNITQGICRGWVSTFPSCAYPSPGWLSIVECQGPPVIYSVAAPGAGVLPQLFMTGFTGTLLAAFHVLTTSAVAGNRSNRIRVANAGGDRITDVWSSITQAAAVPEAYLFGPYENDLQVLTGNIRVAMGPVPFTSLSNFQLSPNNFDAGDAYTQITFTVRLFPEII